MPAQKSLALHVRDATFRARRHHALLAGPVVPWPQLATIQVAYAAATSEPERRAVGVDFERAARDLHQAESAHDDDFVRELDVILALPPVPMTIVDDARAIARYFRAMRAADGAASGQPLRVIASQLAISAATVRRDLQWLAGLQLPAWVASSSPRHGGGSDR